MKTVEISRAKFHEIQKTNNAHDVTMTSNTYRVSPRFLCRPTTLYIFARAVGRQSAIYTENS
jgi:hypothetical protein